MTAEECAKMIFDEMNYGEGLVDGSLMTSDPRAYCQDYMEFIIGVNGKGDLYKWEKKIIKELGLDV